MDVNKLLKLANFFYSLATSEESPANSKDLKTILKNIEGLENYNSRKEYAEDNLEHLSSGSSRIVYLTSKKTIVKLAKNDRGIAQNQAEKNSSKIDSKFLNKALNCATNYSWIEVPYLEKITEKDFKNMTDIDFKDFGEAISFSLRKISGNTDKKKPKKYDEISKSTIFKEMTKIGNQLDLMGGDLARVSSYGQKDDHPVLIDSGLTKKVFEKFYEDSSS